MAGDFDTAFLYWLHGFTSPLFDFLAVAVTTLGDPVVITLAILGMAGHLAYRRRYHDIAFLLASVGGALVLNIGLKLLFERARPDLWAHLIAEKSYSFPSGHAMASAALALSIIIIFWPSKWRLWVVSLGAAYVIVVGLSRLYLGVHYPTDIVAGWLFSCAWVGFVAWLLRPRFVRFGSGNRAGISPRQ